MPVEMRMLTYYQDPNEANISKVSNFSSRESNDNSFFKRKTSADSSYESTNLKNDNVYKPFKQEQKSKEYHDASQSNENDNDHNDDFENNSEKENNKTETNQDKNYNSFFMTQVYQEETVSRSEIRLKSTKPIVSPRIKSADTCRSLAVLNKIDNHYKEYEILFNIENEERIKVPKDISGSVRALKQMLDHPLIFRDSVKELDKPQALYRTILKVKLIKK